VSKEDAKSVIECKLSVNYVNALCIKKTFLRVISLSWFEFSATSNDPNGHARGYVFLPDFRKGGQT